VADQAKNEQAAERLTESAPVRVTKPAERTAVKTRRIAPGHYASLNGQVRVQRQEDGTWTLFHLEEVIEGGFKTSDEGLTAAVQAHGHKLDELNTRPPKPKAEKPAPTPVEAKEPGTNERRSEATGRAPRKTSTSGDTVHVRKTRASKVA
jgi:hypothetical protein